MQASPFTVTEADVERLDEHDLVRLMNRLLWAEGRNKGIPPDNLYLTQRIHDPDGGVDATTNNEIADSDYIPRGLTVWQFKQTKKYPSEGQLRKELRKSKVQEGFRQGAGYTLAWGKGMAPTRQGEGKLKLQQLAEEAGCVGPVRLLVADHVAGWASEVPPALFELRPQIARYYRADQFLQREPRHAVPFEADPLRAAIIEAIKGWLLEKEGPTDHRRIQGRPGVGKTRLALEAVRAAGYDSLTLYSPGVPSSELFSRVAANPQVEPIVIVDECDEAEAFQLEGLARQCQGRLRLLTVGEGTTRAAGSDVYVLDPLDVSVLERVIRAEATLLTPEQVRWVAEKTRGYVKLATSVARAVARGAVNISQLTTDREVREAVIGLLFSGEARSALRGLSLLRRVGWEDEVVGEGQAIASLIGLDWNRMKEVVAPALQEGLLVRKGRYVYISPELLAYWLANEFLETRGHEISQLLEQLPTQASKDALVERLGELGADSAIAHEFARLLGPSGFFRDIDSIDSGESSRLFSALARAAPEAAMGALKRILGGVPHQRLMDFKEGRRHIVWTLESLAECQETFFDAARVLLDLAETENENFSNNASGVWAKLFLTFLGATEVPAPERFILVEEALASSSETRRRLGLDALRAALQTQEMGSPLGERGAELPRPRWRPKTWGEVWEVKRKALSLIDRELHASSTSIREIALDVLLDSARGLVRQGLSQDVVDRLGRLEGESESQQRKIWACIQSVLKYESEGLTEDQRAALVEAAKQIYGDSLADRIKRYVGRWSHVDWPEEGKPEEMRPERIAAQLGEEAVAKLEELGSLLPWLVSGEADNVWPFGFRLGELDQDFDWFERIFEAIKEGKDPRLLSAYMAGRANAGAGEWREQTLDEWANSEALAEIVFDATSRGEGTDQAVSRIVKMIDRGFLDPALFGWLAMRGWSHSISKRALLGILARVAREDSEATSEAGLAFLWRWPWLDRTRDELDAELADYAWRLIERRSSWSRRQTLSYDWVQVAKKLLPSDPARLARAVVRCQLEGEPRFRDERLNLLGEAIRLSPENVLEEIGQGLLSDHPRRYGLILALGDSGYEAELPPEIAISWVRQHGTKAVSVFARTLHLGAGEPPPVARALLRAFPDVVGNIFIGKLHSGYWMGSEASFYEERLEVARRWAEDEDPVVREWAAKAVRSLEKAIDSARLRDAEEFI